MATAIFIHDGNSIDYTPGSNVAAGDVVPQGDLVGIAKRDIVANALGALAVTGVFDVPKATGASTAIAVGAKVHWNSTTKQATTTASGNKYLGKTVKAAVDADATVRVRLEQ
jgi:predicted RecA/RadA family phage recombinase